MFRTSKARREENLRMIEEWHRCEAERAKAEAAQRQARLDSISLDSVRDGIAYHLATLFSADPNYAPDPYRANVIPEVFEKTYPLIQQLLGGDPKPIIYGYYGLVFDAKSEGE